MLINILIIADFESQTQTSKKQQNKDTNFTLKVVDSQYRSYHFYYML